jgi:hypothetical protein
VIPVDQWLGLTEQRFRPGVRERGCREALHCPFEVARVNLQRTAPWSLDGRTLREVVENQGRAVEAAQPRGALLPAFTATECTDQILIGGADGVMVPLVTQQQKDRRRPNGVRKGGRRRRVWGGPRPVAKDPSTSSSWWHSMTRTRPIVTWWRRRATRRWPVA